MKTITYINIESVHPSGFNPRKTFDETALNELAVSIKEKGVIQPIVVRLLESGGYEIVCGERRFRASKLAGLATIPAVIRKLTDDEAMDMAITENLQRKDVDPLEEAAAFRLLIEKGQTIADLAGRFGKSDPYIRGRLKLNDLLPELSALYTEGVINISHCLEICKYPDYVQKEALRKYNGADKINSWIGQSLKYIKLSLDRYTIELDRAVFDKTDCQHCPHNTAVSLLFPDLENVSCQNIQCFHEKIVEHRVKEIMKIAEEHPELKLFATTRTDEDKIVLNKLNERGIPVKTSKTHGFSSPEEAEKKYPDQIEKGVFVRGYQVMGWHVGEGYVYRPGFMREDFILNEAESEKEKEIRELKEKDTHNKSLSFQKLFNESKKFLKGENGEVPTGELVDTERYILFFLLVDTSDYWLLQQLNWDKAADPLRWEIIKNLTDEQKTMIVRSFIYKRFDQAYVNDFQMKMLVEWARAFYPHKVAEIELAQREIYLRRKEKIDARIAEIELEGVGK